MLLFGACNSVLSDQLDMSVGGAAVDNAAGVASYSLHSESSGSLVAHPFA